MNLDILNSKDLYQLLYRIDCDLAKLLQFKNCPHCNSILHFSNYLRKPRGGPDFLDEKFSLRHSLCCSNEACRKRSLPTSCRFWGRKVYWGIIVLVATTLKQNRSSGFSANRIKKLFGVSRHTLKRWVFYFNQIFPVSDIWKKCQGRINLYFPKKDLPVGVFSLFMSQSLSEGEGIIKTLLFLSGVDEMI